MPVRISFRRTASQLARTVWDLFASEIDEDALEPCPYCNTWVPWQARVCNHCGALLMSSASWKEFLRDDTT